MDCRNDARIGERRMRARRSLAQTRDWCTVPQNRFLGGVSKKDDSFAIAKFSPKARGASTNHIFGGCRIRLALYKGRMARRNIGESYLITIKSIVSQNFVQQFTRRTGERYPSLRLHVTWGLPNDDD